MKSIFSLLVLVLIFISPFNCSNDDSMKNNPLLNKFDTPFEVPPFNKIRLKNYKPAFEEGMRQQKEIIKTIVDNQEEASFENTIQTLDTSSRLLDRVASIFFNLKEAITNDKMQKIAKDIAPVISKHTDDIYLNEHLFEKVKKVYKNRTKLVDYQKIRVAEKYYFDFVRRGANLPMEKQKKLRKINKKLSLLTIQFGENLLAETNEFELVISDTADLAGLPQSVRTAANEKAKEKGKEGNWIFTLSKTSWIPFLKYAKNRNLREKLYKGWYMRGDNNNEHDNKKIVQELIVLRAKKAKILGYKNYSDYILEKNMAKNTLTVDNFLAKLMPPAIKRAKAELKELQALADKENANIKIKTWDWWYYAEKLREKKYDLKESELKPYFKLENVRNGMFDVATKLFGITFHEKDNLPVYFDGVETFEVKEKDGRYIGVLYLDYFPRSSKSGGAWCTEFRTAGWDGKKRVHPIVTVVCNFTPPTSEEPSLLTWDETKTLFHEFGHALHSLFTVGQYKRTAGVVPRDYVEMPSQIMENFASEPEVLRIYAKHFKTGEPISDKLIAKIQKSRSFNQGFATTEYLAASFLDMGMHKLHYPAEIEPDEFESNLMQKIGLIKEIIPRYRNTYFAHIFDGGYAAGYYVYIWAEVLDADTFDYLKKSGNIFNPSLADKFRKYCLAECGHDEIMVQYKKFRGKEPSIEPLLKRRGLY